MVNKWHYLCESIFSTTEYIINPVWLLFVLIIIQLQALENHKYVLSQLIEFWTSLMKTHWNSVTRSGLAAVHHWQTQDMKGSQGWWCVAFSGHWAPWQQSPSWPCRWWCRRIWDVRPCRTLWLLWMLPSRTHLGSGSSGVSLPASLRALTYTQQQS